MPKSRSRIVGFRDGLIVLGYRLGWGLLRAVPERFASAVFRFGADLAWRRQGKGIRRLRANLARVLGPEVSPQHLDQVTREAVRSYARYWMEIFRLSVIPQDEIISRMDLAGEDRLWTAMERGKGLVIALPHMGNWDHAGAWLVLRGIPFTTVAERLEPAEALRPLRGLP